VQQQQSQTRNTNPNNDSASSPMEATLKCMTVVEEGSKISFACYDEEKNEIIMEQNRIIQNKFAKLLSWYQ
jgi:hypothetical protein